MSRVHFANGPFAKYADGHPPEKETEAERRRYRKGLTLLRPRDVLNMGPGARAPSSDSTVNWFERFQPRTLEQNDGAVILTPQLKDWRMGIPSIWESFESSEFEKEVRLGTERFEKMSTFRGPPRLCRDSVMSIVEPHPQTALKGHHSELQKELRDLEFEEPDIEALWSRANDSWESNENLQSEWKRGEREVTLLGWHPSGCFNAVLGALRWDWLSWKSCKRNDTAMDPKKSSLWYMCCPSTFAVHCCRNVKRMLRDLFLACGIITNFNIFAT